MINSSKNYKIFPTQIFLTDAKKLAKRFPNIKKDFLDLAKTLKTDPCQGVDLGGGFYKVRMEISDKPKGKSGSARIAIQVNQEDKEVYILRVIDKGEFVSFITDALKKAAEKYRQIILLV